MTSSLIVEIFVVVFFVIGLAQCVWNIYRKKRFVLNVLVLPLLLAIFLFIFFVPRAIVHFHIKMENALLRVVEIADIVIADSCNLFPVRRDESVSEPPDGTTTKYVAFAGGYFGSPAMNIIAFLSPDGGEKQMVIYWVKTPGVSGVHFFEDTVSLFIDGMEEKIPENDESFVFGESAVAIMEKIAEARQVRILFTTQNGETTETEFSEGDICRFRKLRDLWHERIAVSQESQRVL